MDLDFQTSPQHRAVVSDILSSVQAWCSASRNIIALHCAHCKFGDDRLWEPDITVRPVKGKASSHRPRFVVDASNDGPLQQARVDEYFANDPERDTRCVLAISVSEDLSCAQAVLFSRDASGTPVVQFATDFGSQAASPAQLWNIAGGWTRHGGSEPLLITVQPGELVHNMTQRATLPSDPLVINLTAALDFAKMAAV